MCIRDSAYTEQLIDLVHTWFIKIPFSFFACWMRARLYARLENRWRLFFLPFVLNWGYYSFPFFLFSFSLKKTKQDKSFGTHDGCKNSVELPNLANILRPDTASPVSYTHLDVYKRQK